MNKINLFITIVISLTITVSVFAQFDIDLEKKVTNKVNNEINKATDDAINETVEGVKTIGTEEQNEQTNQTSTNETETTTQIEKNQVTVDESNVEELQMWSKYDFVAGEKVIFEDDLLAEENGEFPSRWDLLSGSAEVASLGGENVIHLTHNNSVILPLMDKQDFLPEVFTIEFDVFFEKDGANRSDFYKIRFFEGTGNSAWIRPVPMKWRGVLAGLPASPTGC